MCVGVGGCGSWRPWARDTQLVRTGGRGTNVATAYPHSGVPTSQNEPSILRDATLQQRCLGVVSLRASSLRCVRNFSYLCGSTGAALERHKRQHSRCTLYHTFGETETKSQPTQRIYFFERCRQRLKRTHVAYKSGDELEVEGRHPFCANSNSPGGRDWRGEEETLGPLTLTPS